MGGVFSKLGLAFESCICVYMYNKTNKLIVESSVICLTRYHYQTKTLNFKN